MGESTLSTMRSNVRYSLNNRQANPSDDQIDLWINRAYRMVSLPTVRRHRELQATQSITLTSGLVTYAAASDIRGIFSVRNSTKGYKLNPRTTRWMDNRRRPASGTQARFYGLWGNTFELYPTPGSADNGDTVVARYWQSVALLSADGDVTVLLPEYDQVVEYGAEWQAWKALNRPDLAEIAKDDYARLVNELRDLLDVDAEDWPVEFEIDSQPTMPSI